MKRMRMLGGLLAILVVTVAGSASLASAFPIGYPLINVTHSGTVWAFQTGGFFSGKDATNIQAFYWYYSYPEIIPITPMRTILTDNSVMLIFNIADVQGFHPDGTTITCTANDILYIITGPGWMWGGHT